MASTLKLFMLLPVILLLLQEAYGTIDVEARGDNFNCNKREGPCSQRSLCECDPNLQLGRHSDQLWHYNLRTNRCERGGYRDNCNSHTSSGACVMACER
uniref:R.appendiculatus Kunitz/BPTI-like protein n=1 Tax=Rhipicephalus appendiculatus TaxID=34631 RepID=TICK1_RHIAP|nr:RecName: Full=R.appendiculatus Kunitz/BPTI-like protein; Short=Ra-KLP; AltName: Full=Kunitz/BPTI-like protein; AltName: Full=Pancreatic trypsin inhibitor; Flags: Precursor [Rhipicephalus appendiculatus]ACM86785.1 Kunitz/BPTI-like protein precursor [Rhipicephalus appendiculatus]